MTGADLPNAFPYFIAIERMIDADTSQALGVPILAVYAAVYCIPCLVLLALGMAHGDKVTARLQKVFHRFSTGTVKRSVPAATALFVLAAAVFSIVVWPGILTLGLV